MSEKTQVLAIAAIIGGTFIGAWAWGIISGNPWPVIGWFAVAITISAAGG